MSEIKATTTITLPEGTIVTRVMLDKIQAIINADPEKPVPDEPVVKLDDCTRGPQPKNVEIITTKQIIVGWDGQDVITTDWKVINPTTKEIMGSGQINPTVEMKSKLVLNLDKALVAGQSYDVKLDGVKCNGTGTLNFKVPESGKVGVGISISSVELINK